MSDADGRIRVGVNGYGVIGKRVAEAVARQNDMTLVGVADVADDWRVTVAARRGITLFGATEDAVRTMATAGAEVAGGLDDLLSAVDVVVDCTPKGIGARNAPRYRDAGVRFIVQGGEEHDVTGHSFVADANYASAVGREATRVVSCNTTSIVRTLTALKRAGLLDRARGTLLRRATDPWESHLGGIMNTLVPETSIPSHQAPDARTVDSDLDVVTLAVKVPETLGHLHFWSVDLAREAGREEVLGALVSTPRVVPLRTGDGLGALNAVKELALDVGRPHGDLYEVALWEDLVTVRGRELFYAYMVDNQAIVIPETVDAVRALAGEEPDAEDSMRRTNAALGIGELAEVTGGGMSTPAGS
jgi:glyceraldehyde-3-phosphate dehydrogenase (NAD(P))